MKKLTYKPIIVGCFLVLLLFDALKLSNLVGDAKLAKREQVVLPDEPAVFQAEYVLSDSIFGLPKLSKPKVEPAKPKGPREAMLGDKKVVLKAIVLEERKRIALVTVDNYQSDSKSTVGGLVKIEQGVDFLGYKVENLTLNQVVFTKDQTSVSIKLFEAKKSKEES